ncbi:BTAD domain-containing putative transcriptional regulator [Demequina mangrovi]|uniref:BTAD domain-containing putative transcriptional regulator n=1 Tax=Demequina mangrovi TaxID=1043493 RepID=UPI000694582A|nr:BTAD domain-containing putative transcriptional regulator [Demequina mangrovi]
MGGTTVPVAGSGRRGLLALLAIRRGEPVAVESIEEALWPEGRPPSAVKVVRTYVSHLRALLGGGESAKQVLRTGPAGYALVVPDESVDVRRFERAAASATRTQGPGRLARLEGALALWTGTPFAGIRLPFAEAESARLAAIRDAVEVDLLAARVEVRRDHAAVQALEEIASERPADERVGAALMDAYRRVGRRADALRAHERLRAALADELGVDPDPEIERRYLALLRGVAVASTPPARRSEAAAQAPSLPLERTRLIGREREVREVAELIARRDVVTVIGAGGAGKTRLVLRVAHEAVQAREVVWVGLAGVADGRHVAVEVLHAFGLADTEERDPLDAIAAHARSRGVLVVLDNCEHVAEAVAPVVAALTSGGPESRVLATSRAPLRVPGEQVWRIPAMTMPSAATPEDVVRSEAGRLFVERARLVDAGFEMDDDAAASVAAICARLDGLPLALELAAARASGLPLRSLSEALTSSLGLLTAGGATTSRHRTIEATIAWSHALLSPEESTLLARLSVFAASFDLDAAAMVCGYEPLARDGVATLVANLVDSCVVERTEDRYRMLAPVRQFASERVGAERDLLDGRHAAWVYGVLEQVSDDWWYAVEGWAIPLDRVILDAQAAIERALDRGDLSSAADIAQSGGSSWGDRGYGARQRDWVNRIIDDPRLAELSAERAAQILHTAAHIAAIDCRLGRARALLARAEAAFAQAPHVPGAAWLPFTRGVILGNEGRLADAVEAAREVFEQDPEDPQLVVFGAVQLAELRLAQAVRGSVEVAPALAEASALLARARAVSTAHGFVSPLVYVDFMDGVVVAAHGDAEAALGPCLAALARWREISADFPLAAGLNAVARVALIAGRAEMTVACLDEAWAVMASTGWSSATRAATRTAVALAAEAAPVEAAMLLGVAREREEEPALTVACDLTAACSALDRALGPEETARLADVGASLPLDMVVAHARTALRAVRPRHA